MAAARVALEKIALALIIVFVLVRLFSLFLVGRLLLVLLLIDVAAL